MATIQYMSPGSHTGSHMSHPHQQQPEFTVKEIFLLVASATLDGRGPNRGTQLRRVKPSRISHVLPSIRKFDLMEARPDRTSALDVIKQHLGYEYQLQWSIMIKLNIYHYLIFAGCVKNVILYNS